jgi:phage shock protein A
MTSREPTGQQAASSVADPEELQREIEHTREELGDTVAALAHKLDVKTQIQQRAAEARQRAQDRASQAAGVIDRRRVPLAVTAAVALALGWAIRWWLRRRG